MIMIQILTTYHHLHPQNNLYKIKLEINLRQVIREKNLYLKIKNKIWIKVKLMLKINLQENLLIIYNSTF